MNLLIIVGVSMGTSLFTSYLIMKYQMKMIEKWMDRFFEKEEKVIKDYLQHKY